MTNSTTLTGDYKSQFNVITGEFNEAGVIHQRRRGVGVPTGW